MSGRSSGSPWQRLLRAIAVPCVTALLLSVQASSARAQGDFPTANGPCSGASTCNEDRTVCCTQWTIDIIDNGKKSGAILEDTHEALQRKLESEKHMAQTLCNYFHDASDCNETYGPPHCLGDTSAEAVVSHDLASGVGNAAKLPLGALQTALGAAPTIADGLRNGTATMAGIGAAGTAITVFANAQSLDFPSLGGAGAQNVRGLLMNSLGPLNEYATQLKGAVDRASALRSRLDECVNSYNPFQELDSIATTNDLPTTFGSQTGWMTLGYGFPIPFGTIGDQQRQVTASIDGRLSLLHDIKRASHIPKIQQVQIPSSAVVGTDTFTGGGRLLLGALGTLRPNQPVAGGTYPSAFVSIVGTAVTLSPVETSSGPIPNGSAITLTGSGAGGSETVRLLVCGPNAHPIGGNCQLCSGGSQWEGSQCVCPNGRHWANNECEVCNGGTAWNGFQCVCPSGSNWNGSQCTKPGCNGGAVWNGNTCVCPNGTSWNGAQCVGANQPSAGTPNLGDCDAFVAARGGRSGGGVPTFGNGGDDGSFRYYCQKYQGLPASSCLVFDGNVVGSQAQLQSNNRAVRLCAATPWHETQIPDTFYACCVQ